MRCAGGVVVDQGNRTWRMTDEVNNVQSHVTDFDLRPFVDLAIRWNSDVVGVNLVGNGDRASCLCDLLERTPVIAVGMCGDDRIESTISDKF